MKTSNKPLDLCATVTDWCDVQAESKDTDADVQPKKLRRFSMVAYTGGTMDLVGWKHPVVVDLEGLKIAAKSRPILKDHNRESIVGHTDNISVSNHQLHVSGIISGAGQVAAEIITSSENGFPWQASIGAKAQRVVFISEGKAVTVNGRNFAGPIYIARKSTLGEISFVALGADDNTTARVAAGASGNNHSLDTEVFAMDFESWLTAQDFELAELSETQTANLKAIFGDAQKRAETAKTNDPKDVTATDSSADKDDVDPIANLRAEFVTDLNRIDAIQKICGQEHRDIAAKAIAEGWNTVKTELEVLRASRPKAPAIGSSTPPCTARALEAAACLSAGVEDNDLVEEYGEKTMDAAHPLRHIGLRELVAECARLEGHDIPRVFGDGTATIRAGFSTISLSGILENVMNKTMLAAYQATPIAAFDLCAVGSVSDFKEVTRYRLLGTGGFEQVAPDGVFSIPFSLA